MLVPTLTNHVDSLPLIVHWLKDSSTHPNLFLVPALSFLAYLQFPPPCVSGAVLFPIYIETSQRPIFRSLYLFRWPLPLWNSDADADLESHPVDQLFTQPSFPVLQMQPSPQSIPGILSIPGRSPYSANIEGVRHYKKWKRMENFHFSFLWKSTSGLSPVKSKEGYKRRKRQLRACSDLKTNPFCPKSIFAFKYWHCINVLTPTFQANCCSIKTWKSERNREIQKKS